MKKLNHILEGRIVEIYFPDNQLGRYKIVWDKIPIGYMYIAETIDHSGLAIWVGSTPYVNLYLDELSTVIEAAR